MKGEDFCFVVVVIVCVFVLDIPGASIQNEFPTLFVIVVVAAAVAYFDSFSMIDSVRFQKFLILGDEKKLGFDLG